MPALEDKGFKGSQSHLGPRQNAAAAANANLRQSRVGLGSKMSLAGAQDSQAMLAQALESGQRVYENTFKLKPERKYALGSVALWPQVPERGGASHD
jgi:hypothetical protein